MITLEPEQGLRLLYGGPVFLVTTYFDGTSNVMALTWAMPISVHPNLIGIAVTPSSLTHGLIERSGDFVMNVPDLSLLDLVHAVGTCSGRDVAKLRHFEVTVEGSLMVRAPRLLDGIGCIECEVRDRQHIGDHTLFIAEIVHAMAEPDRFDKRWRPDAYTLHHLGGKQYISNGKVYVPNRLSPGR